MLVLKGDPVGRSVGASVGTSLESSVVPPVGASVGLSVEPPVGASVGLSVGAADVGPSVGPTVVVLSVVMGVVLWVVTSVPGVPGVVISKPHSSSMSGSSGPLKVLQLGLPGASREQVKVSPSKWKYSAPMALPKGRYMLARIAREVAQEISLLPRVTRTF